jgi:hypothetical protein
VKKRIAPSIVEEPIELWRAGAITTDLLSAFGRAPKETRITALIGFLLSMHPTRMAGIFQIYAKIRSVSVESPDEQGRCDILLETDQGPTVIEAKLGGADATAQVSRYRAKKRIVLSQFGETSTSDLIRCISWAQFAERLRSSLLGVGKEFAFLANQLLHHLEANHMVRKTESFEVYAREINEPITLRMFLSSRLYGCAFRSGNKIARAAYFSPHFGARVASEVPGISQGVSYVARVERVITVKDWKELRTSVTEVRGAVWWRRHADLINKIRLAKDWNWNDERGHSFLLLGEPRLAFNPPIRKERLQGGKGFLSKWFYSIDDLYKAWGGGQA